VSFINARGDVCFLNLGRMKAAAFGSSGGRPEFVADFPDGDSVTVHGQAARDIVGHLLATTTAVHGAAAWFEQRWGTKLEELATFLESPQVGRLDQVDQVDQVEDAGAVFPADLCETCDAGTDCPEYRTGRTGTCEGYTERTDDGKMEAEFESVAGGVVEIAGSSADRSSCPHGPAVAEECRLFPRCHVCDRPKPEKLHETGSGFHDPATDCAHDSKEECDDCNDCGAVLRVNCHECEHADKPSCVWANAGALPCPHFERREKPLTTGEMLTAAHKYGRELFFKTDDPHVLERDATREELEHAMKACNVYQGLERARSAPVTPGQDFKCHIGESMDAKWCDVCPYFSSEGC